MQKKLSKSPKDTVKIAEKFLAEILKKKEIGAKTIALSGDLGAGKTFFVKSVGKILKITRKINSPTFVIFKKYSIRSGKYKFLFHMDAYRLKSKKDLQVLGWKEIVSDPRHIIFVEWPENISGAMPKNHHKISILHKGGENREFSIKI